MWRVLESCRGSAWVGLVGEPHAQGSLQLTFNCKSALPDTPPFQTSSAQEMSQVGKCSKG